MLSDGHGSTSSPRGAKRPKFRMGLYHRESLPLKLGNFYGKWIAVEVRPGAPHWIPYLSPILLCLFPLQYDILPAGESLPSYVLCQDGIYVSTTMPVKQPSRLLSAVRALSPARAPVPSAVAAPISAPSRARAPTVAPALVPTLSKMTVQMTRSGETGIVSFNGQRWAGEPRFPGGVDRRRVGDVTWEPLENVNDCAAMDEYLGHCDVDDPGPIRLPKRKHLISTVTLKATNERTCLAPLISPEHIPYACLWGPKRGDSGRAKGLRAWEVSRAWPAIISLSGPGYLPTSSDHRTLRNHEHARLVRIGNRDRISGHRQPKSKRDHLAYRRERRGEKNVMHHAWGTTGTPHWHDWEGSWVTQPVVEEDYSDMGQVPQPRINLLTKASSEGPKHRSHAYGVPSK
ncbi:hypothetical protein GGX14DRAFT_390227 [Mycena pura]|uniref:Uncharacterized protein n=1 Tax=Mycena pura TaxID=153505 RepID=A0AAD6VNQ0_9AGAR|nr:hypothetical protein GGX14DRAFT_390227 [Mycena pura]